jgi:arsenite-transporting ATPase
LRRRTSLHIVTGKGGVGKSTFAAALAIAAARAGLRVLAIEMGGPGGLAGLLGARPVQHGVPVEAGGPHLAYYDGEAALAEYLSRHVPLRGLLERVFAHPLYRAFVAAGPGVRELMAIGKVRDEQLGLAGGAPAWDMIVLDAGASGHALQLLGMPAAAARTFRSGLTHREATKVARHLADPERTAVHVVALPEEMPLEEAAEIVARLRGDLALPLGKLVVNQCRPLAPPGAGAALAALRGNDAPACRALAVAAGRALGWLRLQEEGIAALEARVGVAASRLPRLDAEPFGRPEVERLAGELDVGGAA